MTGQKLALYRSIVREVHRASPLARANRNPSIFKHYRAIFEQSCQSKDEEVFEHDMRNLATLLKSQRMHKVLLDRYNPLHDMTTEERVKATARRVGLDMPVKKGHLDE